MSPLFPAEDVFPAKGEVWDMPPRLYDDTDLVAHPVLVVRTDPMLGWAAVATRTTNPLARTGVSVSHPRTPRLDLDAPGWWRLARLHRVPFANFADPEAVLRGRVSDGQMAGVLNAIREAGR